MVSHPPLGDEWLMLRHWLHHTFDIPLCSQGLVEGFVGSIYSVICRFTVAQLEHPNQPATKFTASMAWA